MPKITHARGLRALGVRLAASIARSVLALRCLTTGLVTVILA